MKPNRADDRCRNPSLTSHLLELIPVIQRSTFSLYTDGRDIEHSTIWNYSSSGPGGWGDQKNDHRIDSGGFNSEDQMWAYPSPHHITRKFVAFPYADPAFSAPGNGPLPMLAGFMPNTTMTLDNVALTVNGFDDGFVGFQGYFEGLNLSGASRGR